MHTADLENLEKTQKFIIRQRPKLSLSKFYSFVLSFLTGLIATSGLASGEVLQLPEIAIETPTLGPGRIEPSRSAKVVDEAEIQKKHPQTAVDVLRDLPGVEVVRQGAAGQTTSLFLRGARSEHTLVLIDGMEAQDAMATSGGFDFSSLSPDNIARIEVFRGPQSVRFGAGALGGVVNIITREGGSQKILRYGMEAGSFQTVNSSTGAHGAAGVVRYSLGLAAFSTEGFSAATKPGAAEKDGTRSLSASLKLNTRVREAEITATFRLADNLAQIDTQGGALGDDPNSKTWGRQMVTGISARRGFFEDRLKSSFGLYGSTLVRDGRNQADQLNTIDSTDHFESRNLKLQSDHSYFIGENHELRIALQWRQERGAADSRFNSTVSSITSKSQSVLGESLTYLFESENLFFDVGGRLDQSDVVGAIPSSHTSIGRFLEDKTGKFYLSYGTGFKLPSLYQLHSIYGDSTLGAENSRTIEFTLEKDFQSKWSTSVAVFENRYQDLIDFNQITNRYFNVARATAYGAELDLTTQLFSHMTATARYGFLETRDETTGQALLRRPRHSGSLSLRHSFGTTECVVTARFKGPRPDIDPTTFSRMTNRGYDLWDFGLNHKSGRSWRIHLRIENIFNRSYQEVAGYNTAALSFYSGLSGEL